MSAEQTILEKLRTLPSVKQQEVLDFVEFLQPKTAAKQGACGRIRAYHTETLDVYL